MSLLMLLIIVVLIAGVGSGPWWGYHDYGYAPSGFFGLVLLILFILLLTGRRF